ncbi:hypothetical protein ACFE04_002680 [Oxalis oulophora]
MDFGVLGLDTFDNSSNGSKSKSNLGSGFSKQERSGSGEDHHNHDVIINPSNKKMALFESRSNSKQEQMLSFSTTTATTTSVKSEQLPFFSSKDATFPYYQSSSYNRSSGYGSGGLNNANMHVPFTGVRGPFTPSQWIELEHQALIYKYLTANVAVPSNLLIPLKKSLYPYGSSTGSFPPSALGWGTFHLGYSGSTDPEPGRCRRTDGKKWRCSRDAVADQKYCERHINRGRHRSRKPVEGQTGQAAASGPSNSKVVPITTSISTTSVIPSGGCASNGLAITQQQSRNLANNSPADAIVKRIQDPRGLSMICPTINLKSNESSAFTITKQEYPFQQSSVSEFGLVSSASLINPLTRNSYSNSKSYGSGSFIDFNEQNGQDQHPLRQFMDEWPKDQSNRSVVTWPEELKSDWTQLSMSIPVTTSDFSSSSSSPTHEKVGLSPLRLTRELDPVEMGLGVNNEINEPNQKLANWIPISWGNSMGGPLGEVLTTTGNTGTCKNPSSLNLLNERWDGSPQFGSSPTGVLHKAPFGSLSNSSSGSSPRANDKNTNDGQPL